MAKRIRLLCEEPTSPPDIGETGRPLIVQATPPKRRRGKPPTAQRLQRNRIVAYVQRLQRAAPGKLDPHIVQAARFFGVHEQTVWNAWRERYAPIDLGYKVQIEIIGPTGRVLIVDTTGRVYEPK